MVVRARKRIWFRVFERCRTYLSWALFPTSFLLKSRWQRPNFQQPLRFWFCFSRTHTCLYSPHFFRPYCSANVCCCVIWRLLWYFVWSTHQTMVSSFWPLTSFSSMLGVCRQTRRNSVGDTSISDLIYGVREAENGETISLIPESQQLCRAHQVHFWTMHYFPVIPSVWTVQTSVPSNLRAIFSPNKPSHFVNKDIVSLDNRLSCFGNTLINKWQ